MNPNTALSGNLNFLHLGDVLQLLGSNGVTGILRIKSKYTSNPGLIYIEKGNPINALCGSESGIDAIHPIQPDARMDIGEVKQRYGKTVCVAGNINCGYTLSQAPVEEVVGEVKEAIRKAGPGGGYIMTSSNSLHSGVKPENYLAMVKTTQTYGKYPLNMQVLS